MDCGRLNWSPGQGTKSTQICALHFEDADFDNFFAWDRGFATRLRLTKEAVPRVNITRVTPERKQQLTRLGTVQLNEGAPVNRGSSEEGISNLLLCMWFHIVVYLCKVKQNDARNSKFSLLFRVWDVEISSPYMIDHKMSLLLVLFLLRPCMLKSI